MGGRSGARVFLLVAVVVLLARAGAALDLYVDRARGDDANDGLSWGNAKASVSAALAAVNGLSGPHTISVAEGRYRERIVVTPDTALLGGFPAGGGARDPRANVTTLDGEGAGAPVVSFLAGTDGSVLDGFTVRGGACPGGPLSCDGGGIRVEDASPLIRGDVIEENGACSGGGVWVSNPSAASPVRIEADLIRRNTAFCQGRFDGRGCGGSQGGGVAIGGPFRIRDSVVEGNSSGLSLGGTGEIFDLLVTGNEHHGIVLESCSAPTSVRNLTAAGNGWSGLCGGSCLEVTDSILWGNGPFGAIVQRQGTPSVAFSLVEGGFAGGTAILDQDPLFVPGPFGDDYLSQTAAGQPVTSPAVDAGDALASGVGLDARTTRTDSLGDAGTLDLG